MNKDIQEYLDEVEKLPLSDILKDSISVPSYFDYCQAYLEQDFIYKIKKTKKALNNMNDYNFDKIKILNKKEKNTKKINKLTEKVLLPLIEIPEKKLMSKEEAISFIKQDLSIFNDIKKRPSNLTLPSKSFSASSSHANFIRKLEKEGEFNDKKL